MDEPKPSKVLCFASFTLDGARACLRGPDGAEVPLAPKPFDLLAVLAHHAGTIPSKNALLDAVWPDVTVYRWDEAVIGSHRR